MTKVSLHRFSALPQRFFLALSLGLGILTVGAIAPPPAPTEAAPTETADPIDLEFTALKSAIATSVRFWENVVFQSPEVVDVTLYTPTDSCDAYIGERAAIVEDKAIPQVVHFLVADQAPKLLDFELAGYRVQQNPKDHSVTIDFRRHPDAQRQFVSLSICEQRILFGSLRETLLTNPALKIQNVHFTEGGRPIRI